MCTNPLWFQKEEISFLYSSQRIISSLKKIKITGFKEGFHITGGEPTIHPGFFEILGFLRIRFPGERIFLITNGRMFYYEDFTRKVLDFDKIVLQIAVEGYNARMHDNITGIKGSFEQTVKGITNVLKNKSEGRELEIRVVLVKQNFRYLDKIVRFIHKNFPGIDHLVLIFPEPEGRCGAAFSDTGITYSQAKEIVFQVANKWKNKFPDLRLYHFPLCTVDRKLWPLCWITQEPEETTFISSCGICRLKEYCPRIHKNYLEIVGDREFVAPAKAIKIKLNQTKNRKYHPIMEAL
jgi:molybdenum cofactor biosynthesis enzyme MoaA